MKMELKPKMNEETIKNLPLWSQTSQHSLRNQRTRQEAEDRRQRNRSGLSSREGSAVYVPAKNPEQGICRLFMGISEGRILTWNLRWISKNNSHQRVSSHTFTTSLDIAYIVHVGDVVGVRWIWYYSELSRGMERLLQMGSYPNLGVLKCDWEDAVSMWLG